MKNETELEKHCDILKQIAGRYPNESAEVRTLKESALAMQLVFLKRLGPELEQLLEENDKPLTNSQRDNLKKMGLR